VAWEVNATQPVEEWLLGLDSDEFDLISPAIDMLQDQGPTLGRPNQRQPAPQHEGAPVNRWPHPHPVRVRPSPRSDPAPRWRQDRRWQDWYRENIPIADDLYDEHLENF
jgi:hypothetical protein